MTTSAPEISVLLPAYQAEATLDACLRSVARQSEPRWECIVVDDGSADGTRAVAERFAARDGRFRVVATPQVICARSISSFSSSGMYAWVAVLVRSWMCPAC